MNKKGMVDKVKHSAMIKDKHNQFILVNKYTSKV
jgi:hypothetical protein